MIITVAHTKGGVGKSTLAWHLAHSFQEIGKTVKIIDLDFQQTLYFINLVGGKPLEVLQVSHTEFFAHTMSIEARNPADIYIIDVGGFDSRLNRAAMEVSDIILIPVGDSITEVLGLKTFEPILDSVAPDVTAVAVLNGIHPSARNLDDLRAAISERFKQIKTVVRQRAAYRQTMKCGKSIFDIADMKPRDEIRGVRDELLRA